MSDSSEYATFWEHLDELRSRIIRVLVVIVVMSVVAFLLKDPLFHVVLAPRNSDFVSYRFLGIAAFSIPLINAYKISPLSLNHETIKCRFIYSINSLKE